MIQVTIRFVDGSLHEFTETKDFLLRLSDLKEQGYEGKDLVNRLITDDWSVPPLFVQIKDSEIDLQIPYS
ncbi:MAG: hypothetical protein U9R20_06995 [Thermodesulfobacteriota bacterium]|nr:hypothetical protein [Thermodesulfobacteriota bacterium]